MRYCTIRDRILISILFILQFCLCSDTIRGGQKDYSEYQVYRFHTRNVSNLVDNIILPITTDYDIWMQNSKFIDIQLSKVTFDKIKNDANNDVDYEIFIADINQMIDEVMPDNDETINFGKKIDNQMNFDSVSRGGDDESTNILSDFFFDEYRNLRTIEIWLQLLKETFPELVKIEKIGVTPDGNDLNVIHISTNNILKNPDKKTIVITGGIHSREWISISTTCYVMYELLSKYGIEKKVTEYLDSLDFIFVPVFNPDGYDYSWTNDRLWRKNRQDTYISDCKGIDIDRSFGYQWVKSNEFPCSESYNGEVEFDAVESKLWGSYFNENKKNYKIFGYLDLHSYSEEILYPYGYSCEALPRDIENLLELSFGLAKAIRLTTHKNYDVIAACKDSGSDLTPGIGGGTALDYMYHNRARWALQLKLRDSGSHGFLLPSKYIRPVGKEIYAAMTYFCEFLLAPEL